MDYLAATVPFYIWGILVFIGGIYFTYLGFIVESYNKLGIFSFALTFFSLSFSTMLYEWGFLSTEDFKIIFYRTLTFFAVSLTLSIAIKLVIIKLKRTH